jgi:hypothetical protein
MNKAWIVLVILCSACGGKLSEEERKKLHEGMATQDIRRVSEADMEIAATTLAQSIMADVERVDKSLTQKTRIDSLAKARQVDIYPLMPDDAALREIEKKLIDAYIAGTEAGHAADNLQKVGQDSLLFTRPIFKEQSDGSQHFSHAIGIKMAKKTVVLSMPAQ